MRLPQGANLGTIWLGTAPDISLTRKRSQWLPAQPIQLVAEEKLRIGLVVSAPEGLGKVDSQTLEKSLQELAVNNPNLVEILPTTAGNPEAINELLERRKPHILHIIAHGRVKGEDNQDVEQLALSDPTLNDPVWVDADYISGILEGYKPALVFLQACDSGALSANQPFFGIASRIVQQNVAVVIAMQYAVTNATANRFSRKFYEKILTGEPVDIAAQDARKFITLGATLYNKRDFATPVIFMRVEEGNLFVAQGNAERVFSPLSMEQPESFKKVLPRRLEGAMPRQATINIITEVRTMISLLDSLGLKQFLPDYTATGDLITKKDAQSNIFPVEFPVNSNNELQAINLYLTLVAQDFDIHNPRIDFMLDPQIDSGIMTFFLIPKKIQPRARIIITVFKNPERTTQLGSLTLVTEVLDEGVAIDKSWRLGATIAELELHESKQAIKGMICTEQNWSDFNIQLYHLERISQQDSRFPPETSRHPQSNVNSMNSTPLTLWKKKLVYLREQEALLSDVAQKFAIKHQIEEAKAKIKELESEDDINDNKTPVANPPKRAPQLTGKEVAQLKQAIKDSFPEDELKLLLFESLNIDYESIKNGNTYEIRIFNLIRQYFEPKGETGTFVQALVKDRPNNQELRDFYITHYQ
jgi:hypothetical protein